MPGGRPRVGVARRTEGHPQCLRTTGMPQSCCFGQLRALCLPQEPCEVETAQRRLGGRAPGLEEDPVPGCTCWCCWQVASLPGLTRASVLPQGRGCPHTLLFGHHKNPTKAVTGIHSVVRLREAR